MEHLEIAHPFDTSALQGHGAVIAFTKPGGKKRIDAPIPGDDAEFTGRRWPGPELQRNRVWPSAELPEIRSHKPAGKRGVSHAIGREAAVIRRSKHDHAPQIRWYTALVEPGTYDDSAHRVRHE